MNFGVFGRATVRLFSNVHAVSVYASCVRQNYIKAEVPRGRLFNFPVWWPLGYNPGSTQRFLAAAEQKLLQENGLRGLWSSDRQFVFKCSCSLSTKYSKTGLVG